MQEGKYGVHIVQTAMEDSLCLGCEGCEVLCGFARDGLSGLKRGGIQVKRGDLRSIVHEILVCQQCSDHPCYNACPKKDDAMCLDERGIVYINEETCIGCGRCMKACTFTPSRIVLVKTGKKRVCRKCDLCRTRAEGPLCIAQCPAFCLELSVPLTEEYRQADNDLAVAN